MPNYRRNLVRGGTYFFTVTLSDRKCGILVKNFECLKIAIQRTKQSYPFKTNSWVVLPDHLHLMLTLPVGVNDFPSRLRAIKTYFCVELGKYEPKMQMKNIWQRGYWEHTIRNEEDYRTHMDYVHINPLKHGYVKRVSDWPYSSFHSYVEKGIYSNKWGESIEIDESIKFGE